MRRKTVATVTALVLSTLLGRSDVASAESGDRMELASSGRTPGVTHNMDTWSIVGASRFEQADSGSASSNNGFDSVLSIAFNNGVVLDFLNRQNVFLGRTYFILIGVDDSDADMVVRTENEAWESACGCPSIHHSRFTVTELESFGSSVLKIALDWERVCWKEESDSSSTLLSWCNGFIRFNSTISIPNEPPGVVAANDSDQQPVVTTTIQIPRREEGEEYNSSISRSEIDPFSPKWIPIALCMFASLTFLLPLRP